MPTRQILVRSALFSCAVLAGSVVACSSATPDDVSESIGKTSQDFSVPQCNSPTQGRYCTTYETLHGTGVSCVCQDWVTPNTGDCGAQDIPPPSQLPNCKEGFWAGDSTQQMEPVWACPVTYENTLPSRIGTVGTQYPTCVPNPDGGAPATLPCTEVIWLDGFDAGNCISTAPDDYGFVWEHVVTNCCYGCCAWDSRGQCIGGGGCPGPCALKP